MNQRLFFRVANIETLQGLWYDYRGNYTGLIHNDYNFCTNSNLPMPFNPDIRGWLSATSELTDLWLWFPKKDIFKLQTNGWYLYGYLATEWKDHANHQVIKQDSSIPFMKYIIGDNLEIENTIQIGQPKLKIVV